MGVGVGVRGFRVRATQEVSCLLPAALRDLVDAHVHRRAALDLVRVRVRVRVRLRVRVRV